MRDGLADRLVRGEAVDLAEEEVPASLIRDLLTDDLDQRGLRISGARVSGPLDLSDVRVSRPLVLRDCVVEGPVLLDRSRFASLDLNGLVAPSVSAPWLKLDHYLLLQNARLTCADGWALDLGEAEVGAHVSLRGAVLEGVEYALNAPKLRTGSQLYLTDVRATGTVRLDGARIGGTLYCRSARLKADESALLAMDIQVDERLLLGEGFEAVTTSDRLAAVRIRGARLGGQLVLRGCTLRGTLALDVKQVRPAWRSCSPRPAWTARSNWTA